MILPELGGRVQMALDKTNGYHFIYYNHVIKPALVGLAGPWISGGIEFNWPQHHRPSTFDPLERTIQEHQDGTKTVWCGEKPCFTPRACTASGFIPIAPILKFAFSSTTVPPSRRLSCGGQTRPWQLMMSTNPFFRRMFMP